MNATLNTTNCTFADIAFDSKDNVLLAYLCEHGNVTYSVIGPDHELKLGPKVLAWSRTGAATWPHIAVDSKDTVHIFYANESDSSPKFFYHDHIRMDVNAANIEMDYGGGGAEILVDRDDNLYGYSFYRKPAEGAFPPPEEGNISLFKSDGLGNTLWSRKVGWNTHGFEEAAFALGPDGDIHFAYMCNDTHLNYTRITKDGVVKVQEASLIDLGYGTSGYPVVLLQVDIAVDANGTAHVFYLDETQIDPGWPDPYCIHKLKIGDGGTILNDTKLFNTNDAYEADLTVSGPDKNGTVLLVDGAFAQVGTPEDEPAEYYSTLFSDLNGDVVQPYQPLTASCPASLGSPHYINYFGEAGMNRSGAFHFVTHRRSCYNGGWGPGVYRDDISDIVLFYTDVYPQEFYDVAVWNATMSPAQVYENGTFELRADITNLGPGRSTSIRLELTYSDNGTLITASMGTSLEMGWKVEGVVVGTLSVPGPTNLSIHAVPGNGLDVNLTNNWANLTVVPLRYSDVRIIGNETGLYPSVPHVGDGVLFNITIRNDGDVDVAADIMLDGGPPDIVPLTLPAKSGTLVNFNWTPTMKGEYSFTAHLSNVTPPEKPGREWDNVATIDFTVRGHGPLVTITSPVNGSDVDGPTSIVGSFIERERDSVTLTIFVDGMADPAALSTNDTNFSFMVDFSAYDGGPHNVTVLGCDEDGCSNSTIRVNINRTVPVQNRRPVITGDNSETIVIGCVRRFGVTVVVWDPDGDRLKVDWYMDGTLIYSMEDVDPDNKTMGLAVDGDNLTLGRHVLRATVSDGRLDASISFDIFVNDTSGCGGEPPPRPPTYPNEPPPATQSELGWPYMALVVIISLAMVAIGVGLEVRRSGREADMEARRIRVRARRR